MKRTDTIAVALWTFGGVLFGFGITRCTPSPKAQAQNPGSIVVNVRVEKPEHVKPVLQALGLPKLEERMQPQIDTSQGRHQAVPRVRREGKRAAGQQQEI